MAASDRPGGLTALATFNFVGALIMVMFTIGQIASVAQGGPEASVLQLTLFAANTVLLVLSGIGYMIRSRPLGWGLGHAYVAAAIALNYVLITQDARFSIQHLFVFVPPVLNLVLINTAFRIDLGGRRRAVRMLDFDPGTAPRRVRGHGFSVAHAWLVARYASRFALRTGGGVAYQLLLITAGILLSMSVFVPIEEWAERTSDESAVRTADALAQNELVVGFVEGLVGDERTTRHLLTDRPALLSALMLFLFGFLPFFVCAGAFNQFSGDIASRGLRYLLLRTDRSNIFFGRFVGTAVFTLAGIAFLFATLTLYVQLRFRAYPPAELWGWAGEGFLAAALFTIPHLAIGSLISASLRSPFGSLALCYAAVGMPLVLIAVLRAALHGRVTLDWLTKLLPWGWRFAALSPDLGDRLLGAVVLLAWAAGLLWVGLTVLRRRDL